MASEAIPAGSGEAVELGHADVHQRDIRSAARDHVHGGAPVVGLTDDFDVRLGFEDHAKARAEQTLVVGDHHRDRSCRRVGLVEGGLLVLVLVPVNARHGHGLGESLEAHRAGRLHQRGDPCPGDAANYLAREHLARSRGIA